MGASFAWTAVGLNPSGADGRPGRWRGPFPRFPAACERRFAARSPETGVGGCTVGASPKRQLPHVPGMATINVSPGDALDPHLDGDLAGQHIEIPAGTYVRNGDWNVSLSGTTVEGIGGQVVIDSGDRHNKHVEWVCHNDSTVRDLTFAGRRGTGGPGQQQALWASSGAELAFENCRWPDGAVPGDAHCMYVRPEHQGVLTYRNCLVAGFADNGIYGSAPGAGGGQIRVESCEFRNNNVASVRLGGSGSYVRDTYFEVSSSQTPGLYSGAKNARGVWIHSSGDYTVENCDFVFNTSSGSPINANHGDAAGSTTEVRNCRIQQDGGANAMYFDEGRATGGGNHITGSGNLSTPGADHTVACRGSGCEEPSSSPGSGSPDVEYDHLVVVDSELSAPSSQYSVTLDGPTIRGPEAEGSTSDTISRSGDNYIVRGTVGSGYTDSWKTAGSVVDFSAPSGVTVLYDGSPVGGQEPEPPEISTTFNGHPKTDYYYCGTESDIFQQWRDREITTDRFRTETSPGQGTAALQLEPCEDADDGQQGPKESGSSVFMLAVAGAALGAIARHRDGGE